MPGIDWQGFVKVWHFLNPDGILACGREIGWEHGGVSHMPSVNCGKCLALGKAEQPK